MKVGKEVEKGWFKLKWRPIFKGTYNFYIGKPWRFGTKLCSFWSKISKSRFGIGFHWFRADAHNGHGRAYEKWHFGVQFLYWTIDLWIAWKFIVMEDKINTYKVGLKNSI